MLYATNLGVVMGEPRALEGRMDNFSSYVSHKKDIHSVFSENAACILKNPADNFKCIQIYALSINKCKYTLDLAGALAVNNFRGEKKV